ncbi:MAG: [FeFe] hydrogenase H-cluster radical SAM maturase HydE [bacterium]
MPTILSILHRFRDPSRRAPTPSIAEVLTLLRAQGEDCAALFAAADNLRRRTVGDDVHVRGIIEFSNYCTHACGYCGIRRGSNLVRYRMTPAEIVAQARQARGWGCNTVVLQSGADPWFTAGRLCKIVRAVRQAGIPAVTLSVGVRPLEELRQFAAAGCDRYLLRFETSNRALFRRIHPDETFVQRQLCLRNLRTAGIQVGSGFMIGLPGTPLATLARDILYCTRLDLDMIGCGPFLAHPGTPLGGKPLLADREIYFKTMAILRLLNPWAHIPATTAFDALAPDGRNRVLQLGANVFMPNVTPGKYRRLYQLYPNKPCVDEDGAACVGCVRGRIAGLGRRMATGPGHTLRPKTAPVRHSRGRNARAPSGGNAAQTRLDAPG